ARDGQTLRQLQVGQVQCLAHLQVLQVDFDEVGQILGQTADFNFRQVAEYHAAFLLDAYTDIFVGEVQGYLNGNLLTGNDALEVGVQDARLGRVTLQKIGRAHV